MLRFALLLLVCAPLCAQTYVDHLSFGGISPDTAYGVACDTAGNSYGVYHFDGTIDVQPGTGTHDITGFFAGGVVKYDSNRAVTWAQVIEPVNPGDSVIPEMPAVDSAGNVYVVGRFFGQADFDPGTGTAIESALDTTGAPATNYNAFLLKLDATGAFQWVRVLRGGYTWGTRVSCTDTRVCITGIYNGTMDLDHTAGTQYASAAGLASFDQFSQRTRGVHHRAADFCSNDRASQTIADAGRNLQRCGIGGVRMHGPVGQTDLNLTGSGGKNVGHRWSSCTE